MKTDRESPGLESTYALKAIPQVHRLLSSQDRNPFSPTYGCFHRDYWLDKTSDFPDAVRQFAVHALALVYTHDFPGNPFQGRAEIRDWTVAGLDFWAGIQHEDGSFDEFYPYERGWVGPTAFTTYTAAEAIRILGDEVPERTADRVRRAILKAARFIAKGESEEDHLANHHAMACLAVWKAYELLGDEGLRMAFDGLWETFLGYHNADEGWSREYDGVDPGYLSATVSFLAKVYQTNPDPEIFKVLQQSVEFCSYFVYPDGFYGGLLGSRNTQHFYPHGFEILSSEIPLAAAVSAQMLEGLAAGAQVPPEIMPDRYLAYRIPEYLLSYLDFCEAPAPLPPLPWERDSFHRYFEAAGIHVAAGGDHYSIANLSKGGVVKVLDRKRKQAVLVDGGFIGRLSDGSVVTTQWIDEGHEVEVSGDGWAVSGSLNEVPTHKVFTPFTNLLFRSALVCLGWSPRFSHWLKGMIRKSLMLGIRRVPVHFRREFSWRDGRPHLRGRLRLDGKVGFQSLAHGGEFFVRYVPQSRYFQLQELGSKPQDVGPSELRALREGGELWVEAGTRDKGLAT